MKAERQQKERTSRVIQPLKKYKKYMIDNRPSFVSQAGFRNSIVQKKLVPEKGEGCTVNVDKLVSDLWKDIIGTVGKDHVVEMVEIKDIKIKVLAGPSTNGGGGYDASTNEIMLYPEEILITHENRDRLYNQGSEPKYDELGLSAVKANFGMLGLSTVLYHELGHYYQANELKLDLNKMCKKESGRFLVELHNILQTENKMAVKKDEPLRSSYKAMGSLHQSEIKEVSKRGKFKLSGGNVNQVESVLDDDFDEDITQKLKKTVEDYAKSLRKWMDEQSECVIDPQVRENVNAILENSLDVVGGRLRRSQVYLLQGIIDSAYYYLRDLERQQVASSHK